VLQAPAYLFRKGSMMNLRRGWWRRQKLGLLGIPLILMFSKGLRYKLAQPHYVYSCSPTTLFQALP